MTQIRTSCLSLVCPVGTVFPVSGGVRAPCKLVYHVRSWALSGSLPRAGRGLASSGVSLWDITDAVSPPGPSRVGSAAPGWAAPQLFGGENSQRPLESGGSAAPAPPASGARNKGNRNFKACGASGFKAALPVCSLALTIINALYLPRCKHLPFLLRCLNCLPNCRSS